MCASSFDVMLTRCGRSTSHTSSLRIRQNGNSVWITLRDGPKRRSSRASSRSTSSKGANRGSFLKQRPIAHKASNGLCGARPPLSFQTLSLWKRCHGSSRFILVPLTDRPVGYVAVRLSTGLRPRRPPPHSVGCPRNRVNSTLARAADGTLPVHWGDEDADGRMTQLRALAMECDALSQRVAAAGGDAVTVVASIGLPGTRDGRTPDRGRLFRRRTSARDEPYAETATGGAA